MAFTYNAAELSAPVNHLRFLTQDTTETSHFFEDEEIAFIYSKQPNVYRAAAGLCRAIAAKLAQTPSLKDTNYTFDSESRIREMRFLADQYEAEAVRAEKSLEQPATEESSGFSLTSPCAVTPTVFTSDLHFTK